MLVGEEEGIGLVVGFSDGLLDGKTDIEGILVGDNVGDVLKVGF